MGPPTMMAWGSEMAAKQQFAQVAIGEKLIPVGELRFTRDGARQHSVFTYGESWIENDASFQLSPELELRPGTHYANGKLNARDALHGPFADVAPDSWGRRLLERAHGAGLSEFDLLVLADDFSRHGALRFLDGQGDLISGGGEAVPRLLELDRITAISRGYEQGMELTPEDLKALTGAGATLGGARPKANVLDGVDLWLAKFTSVHDTHPIEQMEVATLLLAAECGIRVPEVRLEMAASPYPVALIKRFDRQGANRVPYISARTALGKGGTEAGSYTEIAEFIRAWSAKPVEDLREIFLRLVFTILVSNKDDHLKNHGFVYAGGNRWRLSRMFDVNPAPEREPHLETAIMEGEPFDRCIELAMEACEFFDLSKDDAAGMIQKAAATISARWREILAHQGVTGARARHYEPAFDHHEMDKALSI